MKLQSDNRVSGAPLLLLIALAPLAPLPAQYSTEGKPARSLLYGKHETASVDLTRLGVTATDDESPWQQRTPPLTVGTDTTARLWTDLPITIDTLLIPAGTYLLTLEAPRTLLIASEAGANREPAFTGRVLMAEGPSDERVLGWSLAVVTTRFGDDTLSLARKNTPGMGITTISHGPASRSVLRLRYLDRELKVAIAAR